jgi:hypothetical protein
MHVQAYGYGTVMAEQKSEQTWRRGTFISGNIDYHQKAVAHSFEVM